MKKIISLVLILAVSLSIIGCGNKSTKYIISTDTAFPPFEFTDSDNKIGRASCRERVLRLVFILVVFLSLKKK